MNYGFVKVAAGSPEVAVADCIKNAASIALMMNRAEDEGVKLLVLPELCITGYTCGDLFLQPTLLSAAKLALMTLASVAGEMLTVVGLPMSHRGKLYNCAAFIQNGRVLGVVPKTHLPNYGEFYERRHFEPAPPENGEIMIGNVPAPFGAKIIFSCSNLEGFDIACEICEDLWAANPPSVGHALNGATVIVNPSAGDEAVMKASYRRELVGGQSARLICGYILASAGEGESTTDLVFGGHNLVYENGATLAEKRFAPGELTVSELDLGRILYERRRNTVFTPSDGSGYVRVPFSLTVTQTKLTRKIARLPFVPEGAVERGERCEEILNIQALGLKKRVAHTGVKKLVIGVSGGLDSTLALLVSARTMKLLGRPMSDIVAITMPCFGTTERTRSNAELLAERLGAELKVADITKAVERHFEDIGHDINDHSVVFENAQARERTQVLMDWANGCEGLVVGTGDMSELALGWATYNGDHMSMYGVNASVPKTLVRWLVGFEAMQTQDGAVRDTLYDILATPVSPELLPAEDGEITQKTEDIVGPYELHDFFLYYAVRWGFPPKKVRYLAAHAFANDYDRETIKKWLVVFYRRFFAQQYKRSCLPDGPKTGSVALSPRGDWRMPSDASAELWLRELETDVL